MVFSKDRPYQLLSSLASLIQHVKGVHLAVSVLFKASTPEFSESYAVVRGLFQAEDGHAENCNRAGVEMCWLEETGEKRLGELLDEVLAQAEGSAAGGLLFTVDDALWFSPVRLSWAVRA